MRRFRDWGIVLGLVIISLIPRLALIFTRGFEIFHSDHAVFGLMAKHILEGKPMVYYYGQAYMGSLEAYVGALIALFRGVDLISVLLAPLVFYVLFLAVNFFLLKRLFGLRVSILAQLLLTLSPPGLTMLSVTALGGYPETLFFGSLTLLLLSWTLESRRKGWMFFLTGLIAGIGLWTNNLILLYFLALGLFVLVKSKFWKETHSVALPPLVRSAALVLHGALLLIFLWNFAAFFFGDKLSVGGLTLGLPSPPFHVKKMKKILLVIAGDAVLLSFFAWGAREFWRKLRAALPLATGFLLGASPAILYALLGGEGYRVIHGSGTIHVWDLPAQVHSVIWKGFVEGIWGVPAGALRFSLGAGALRALGILFLCLGLFIHFCFLSRRQLKDVARYPLFLTAVVLAVCLLSNLQAGRYLIPLYFAFSLIFALSLARMKRAIAGLLLVLLLAHQGWANYEFIRDMPSLASTQRAYGSILSLLKERQIRGAYAQYVFSYVLTLMSREEIIVAPHRSPDRYPAYTQFVNGLDRVAYLFEETDWFAGSFQKNLDLQKISYEKIWVEPFWVFVIDRSRGTELGKV